MYEEGEGDLGTEMKSASANTANGGTIVPSDPVRFICAFVL